MAKFAIKLVFLILLATYSCGMDAQNDPVSLKVGDLAPPMDFDTILQTTAEAENIKHLINNKVIVLDFWATWCAPCRKAIPHVNGLVKEFSHRSVLFISVSDEEEWKVKNFLKINPISGWIGLDRDGSMFKAYGFKTIPQAVVIDREGRIAALTSPESLDAAIIKKVLAGGDFEPSGPIERTTVRKAEGTALFELSISPASASNFMRLTGRSFKANGMTLRRLLSIAYDVSPGRMAAQTRLADETFAVSIVLPKNDRLAIKSLLRQAIELTFGLKHSKETRDKNVYVLRTSQKTQSLLRVSRHHSEMAVMADTGQLSSQSTSIQTFCAVLEDSLGKMVVNETDLDDLYEIALYWKAGNPNSIVEAIEDQLGLLLTTDTRPVEITVFTTDHFPDT